MSTEVIGIDHIYITVTNLDRSIAFYDAVMIEALGFRKNIFTINNALHVQYYNRLFGYVLRPASPTTTHNPYHSGLHHLCLRVEDVAAVRQVAQTLQGLKIPCSALGHYPEYAPDYYAIHLQDPDGIHLEITNYRQERRDRAENWDKQMPEED